MRLSISVKPCCLTGEKLSWPRCPRKVFGLWQLPSDILSFSTTQDLLKQAGRSWDKIATRTGCLPKRKGDNWTELIFIIIFEQSAEWQTPLCNGFINFKEAFDRTSKDKLLNNLRHYVNSWQLHQNHIKDLCRWWKRIDIRVLSCGVRSQAGLCCLVFSSTLPSNGQWRTPLLQKELWNKNSARS